MEGKLVIVSAPSGAGKTTIVRHLLASGLNLAFSVSATTRPIRGNEKDGTDYFFMTVSEFKNKIRAHEFIEWEEVYGNFFYGTLKSEMERIWANGNHVIFDVDVRGGLNLKRIFGEKSIALFIMPPSVDDLEDRLKTRATDSPEKIRIRVEKAHEELLLADQFDEIIINDNLDSAKSEAVRIVSAFLSQ